MSTRASTRFWSYIEHSVDQIVATLDGLEADELNWRPAGAETNSLFVLATHMLGALDETLLGVLCGQPRPRDRDAEFGASDATADPLRAGRRRAEIAEQLTALDEQLDAYSSTLVAAR